MSEHATETVSVTEYLVTRLRQLGVDHLFGVPGDFTLALLDALDEADGPRWVGTANELGAAYAADGYARRRGFAALLTTCGVGELSAINGVAGAFAEHVPVLAITGAPATQATQDGLPLHHSLLDGDFGHFARAYAEVTVAQAVLGRGDDAGAQIDGVLLAMLDEHRPGYLSIPADLVDEPVAAAPLQHALAPRDSDPRDVAAFRRDLTARLAAARDVVLLTGAGTQRAGAAAALQALAEAAQLPVATLSDAKGLIDEAHPLSLGLYAGALAGERTRELVESADLLVLVGAQLSDTLTGSFTARLDDDAVVEVGLTRARIGDTTFDVRLRDALAVIADVAAGRTAGTAPAFARDAGQPAGTAPALTMDAACAPATPEGDDPLTQAQLWSAFSALLPAGHTVVADAGTSYFGVIGEPLPADTALHGQPIWSSIGYSLPAGLGTQLAEPERRTVVVIGDGAAQMTIQELGTMLRERLHPIVVLVDNDGYTIERMIRGPHAAYNDIARWNWPLLVRALGGDAAPVALLEAGSADELTAALRRAHELTDRLVFLQVHTAPLDVPAQLAALGRHITQRAVTA